MQKIIIAFGHSEDSRKIKSILVQHGYEVSLCCTTAARVLSVCDDEGGIVICGYRLPDMTCMDLSENLPPSCKILLIASPQRVEETEFPAGMVFLPLPLKIPDLLSTLDLMLHGIRKRRRTVRQKPGRSDKDRLIIEKAKGILMERNHMTEPEAHRYLQKCAMDSGNSMADTAAMLIAMTR
jgi:response regulator NasT